MTFDLAKLVSQFRIRILKRPWTSAGAFLIAVTLWNVLLLGFVGYQVSRIWADFEGVARTESALESIQSWSSSYPWLSLGVYRLPYVHESYVLARDGSRVALEGMRLLPEIEALAQGVLSGETRDWAEWEVVLDDTDAVFSQVETDLMPQTENGRIRQLVRLFAEDTSEARIEAAPERIATIREELADVREFLPTILGYEAPQHVVVLTQNNMELWPTGGYLGSYLEFWLEDGAMRDFHVEAIDVPNGQIAGYVEAPEPISTYVHNGGTPGWRLRESNWNPDFPEAARDIEWFFVEGKVESIDTMIATNLLPLQDFIAFQGELYVPDFDVRLTSETFYEKIQQQTSYDFFPGSTQKRDFLGRLARQLLYEVQSDPGSHMPALLSIVRDNLATKQVMVTSKDVDFQAWLSTRGWDGGLTPSPCHIEGCIQDYLHVNEANVGINKANCCIDRRYADVISIDEAVGVVRHQFTMSFDNHNPAVPEPPAAWGGGYKVYVRLYVPLGSELVSVTAGGAAAAVDGAGQEEINELIAINFLGLVGGGKEGSYTVEYTVPYSGDDLDSYQLHIQKQSGVRDIPWQLSVQGQGRELSLDRDHVLTFSLGL